VRVSVDGTELTIHGGARADAEAWTVRATLNPQSGLVLADFSSKGGPSALRGQATTELPEAFSEGGAPGIMCID